MKKKLPEPKTLNEANKLLLGHISVISSEANFEDKLAKIVLSHFLNTAEETILDDLENLNKAIEDGQPMDELDAQSLQSVYIAAMTELTILKNFFQENTAWLDENGGDLEQ